MDYRLVLRKAARLMLVISKQIHSKSREERATGVRERRLEPVTWCFKAGKPYHILTWLHKKPRQPSLL